jgi:hypothetical protein
LCPGTRIIGPRAGANVSTGAVDPDLDAMRLEEAVVGLERQLRPNLLLTARDVHNQIDRAIEDIGSIDADSNEVDTVGNPVHGRAAIAYRASRCRGRFVTTMRWKSPMRRTLTGGWTCGLSYVWSRLCGNHSGLSQSDEDGRVSPNAGRLCDYPLMMFTEKGRPVCGPLATNRPNQLEAHLVYSAAFGLNVGGFQFVESGLPVSREARVIEGSDNEQRGRDEGVGFDRGHGDALGHV